MKAIIDDVMYDTMRAKRLCKYFRNFKRGGILTPEERWHHRVVLYQAKNGDFFERNLTKKCLQAVDAEDAKDNIKRFAPKKYVRMYGDVTDASDLQVRTESDDE